MSERTSAETITVLGLGAMGAAISRAAASAGHRVVAWNRTPRSKDELAAAGLGGVEIADAPSSAVAPADLVVVCVRNHEACADLLEQIAPHLRGQVVVNVSTGTPDEAVGSAARAQAHDIRYVTGAVMVPTPMVGTDQCAVLYAGATADLADLAPLFDCLGGTSDVTGTDHAVPPTLDLAMLDIYFTGMYVHLHATALAAAHGIEPSRFLPYAQNIVETLGGSLPGLTTAVERRTYDSGEARLDMCLSFLEHIVSSSREAGIGAGTAALVRDASAQAMANWPGSTDWDVVAETLGEPAHRAWA